MKEINRLRTHLMALGLLAPLVAGCSGASDLLSKSKDAEWFSRPGRLFIKNISIETPPLSPNKPVTAEDLVSAEGACPAVGSPGGPADANASANTVADAGAPSGTGTVALGHTECDVVRGIGPPDGVNLSSNQRGDRVAVVTWSRGPRAGIYTFTAGRLSSIEGTPAPQTPPKSAKPKKKSSAT